MVKKKDFLWRYQPPFDSNKARMLNYIQNRDLHPFQDKTMMIMNALNAYYMALALYGEGNHSREDLELIFLDSVKAIAHHLQYVSVAIKVDVRVVTDVLSTVFEGLSTRKTQPEQQFNSSPELTSSDTCDEFELNDVDLQAWNLAGITTDSETFS